MQGPRFRSFLGHGEAGPRGDGQYHCAGESQSATSSGYADEHARTPTGGFDTSMPKTLHFHASAAPAPIAVATAMAMDHEIGTP